MNKILLSIIFLISSSAFAGGDSVEVSFISLNEIDKDEYELKYKEINSEKIITVKLEYDRLQYLMFKPLNFEKYQNAIMFLKKQIQSGKPARFGAMGGGPCIVDKTQGLFRSDALDIYTEYPNSEKRKVVYAFCEYS